MKYNEAISLITTEYCSATKKFGPFASAHEGYAIILEELDELWEVIKNKQKSITELEKEAVQVAAMAVRFLVDMIDW